jgi:solute:Na+ symporter, SSS family
VWADLLQGSALIVGGGIIMFYAFGRLGELDQAATVANVNTGEIAVETLDPHQGAVARFMTLNHNQLNMFLPADDPVVPWTSLLLGLWIPNFYYWGLNQYITQRTLGSSSLSEGQKGIVFAAYLKLLIPFIVVIPGIIAFNIFHRQMQLDAGKDAGAAMALYLKANPGTQFVRTVEAPDAAAVTAHTGPTYLIALYDSQLDVGSLKVASPYVLPMTRQAYEQLEPAPYLVFSHREDRAWAHVNPELAQELNQYNERVEAKAKAAGEAMTRQALVAYKYDTALGQLLTLLPQNSGLFGFVMAALLGAVISSLAAMLNAASSIFTLDLVQKYVVPDASQRTIVLTGRVCVVVSAIIACGLAPVLGDPNISNSIFTIIQESQGFISPGILAVFVIGLVLHRCPRWAGMLGLLTSIVCYGLLRETYPSIQFLNRMAVVFGLCIAVMALAAIVAPLREPVRMEAKTNLDLTSSRGAKVAGVICILLTISLYVIFSPLLVARQ